MQNKLTPWLIYWLLGATAGMISCQEPAREEMKVEQPVEVKPSTPVVPAPAKVAKQDSVIKTPPVTEPLVEIVKKEPQKPQKVAKEELKKEEPKKAPEQKKEEPKKAPEQKKEEPKKASEQKKPEIRKVEKPAPSKEEDEEVVVVAERPAEPLSGYPAYYRYIKNSLEYPEEAKKHNAEGQVFVEFIVRKDGSVTDVHVPPGKGIGYGCDEEAIRVVKQGEKWKPALNKNGQPVSQRVVLPIKFKLN
ncbi:MAG: TonB family protein [Cytophagales bacterium]|nr:TonB family protein [Bernardetiaceae bacterium]MDW8211714.1 TonB family protein [Cytophagales bacterium]